MAAEENVRQHVVERLRQLGWPDTRLRWKPEWPVPRTPHDLTKRERGQRYETAGSCDLVTFADDSGQPHALQVIFEFKAPGIGAGREQLQRYLSSEPQAKMGYWTDGDQSLAIYKRHAADWLEVVNAPLPRPGDDLTKPPDEPPTWRTLTVPSEAELAGALRRILSTIASGDSRATRREDQLREVLHVVLVKLQSDAVASRSKNQDKPVSFRIHGDETTKVLLTAKNVQEQYYDYYNAQRTRIFHQDDRDEILLDDESIFKIVAELAPYRILGDDVDLLAKAFQIFRTKALKSAEGQFLTPQRIVKPCVAAMEIRYEDKVIDPGCGTGGFLVEALRQVRDREFPDKKDDWNLIKWANDNLYGVDIDAIGVKLTRAIMVAMRDGSTHVLLGDAVRTHDWQHKYPRLREELCVPGTDDLAEQFTVALTNPPFGRELKVKAADARAGGYTIANAAAMKGPTDHRDLEIGLIYLELCYRLVKVGGRVGIVLPETYFFSYKYRWLPDWMEGRLALRGMLNIPMEAFQEFCRAKTNFYIFEKVGYGPDADGGRA